MFIPILEDDWSVDMRDTGFNFGTRNFVVKTYNTTFEDMIPFIEGGEVYIEKLVGNKLGGVRWVIKDNGKKYVIRKAPWNPPKKLEKYGLEFRPNYAVRAFDYIDDLQRIEIRGWGLLVGEGNKLVEIMGMYPPHEENREMLEKYGIDTSLPLWWYSLPHYSVDAIRKHEQSWFIVDDYLLYKKAGGLHSSKVDERIKTSQKIIRTSIHFSVGEGELEKIRIIGDPDVEENTVIHTTVPFLEGVYTVKLPFNEIVYLDRIMSVRELPKSAELEPIIEVPFKINTKNMKVIYDRRHLTIRTSYKKNWVSLIFHDSDNYDMVMNNKSLSESEKEVIKRVLEEGDWWKLQGVLSML